LALLIQLPPSLTISKGLEGLRQLLPALDNTGFRYAVEVRHNSWFQDLAYNFFTDNNICMVWSQLANMRTPPIVTTGSLGIEVYKKGVSVLYRKIGFLKCENEHVILMQCRSKKEEQRKGKKR
jgi:Protein of unknown function DUF72